MDIKKFKSVAVAIDTYKLLKKIAELDDRSAGMQITYLVKQEAKKLKNRRTGAKTKMGMRLIA